MDIFGYPPQFIAIICGVFLPIAGIIWLPFRIVRSYRRGQMRSVNVQLAIWAVALVTFVFIADQLDVFVFLFPYLIVFGTVLLFFGLALWSVVRIIRAFRSGRRRAAWIKLVIWAAVVLPILWITEVLPLSRNVRFMDQAENLSGRRFWGWKEDSIDEASVRGEGYWLEVFTFDEEVAEYFKNNEPSLFAHTPTFEDNRGRPWSGWKRTPIEMADSSVFKTATPIFVGWTDDKEQSVHRMRRWGRTSGSYYAYYGDAGALNFYLINPADRAMAIIYSNP
ncbi:MAG: hypothetical protein KF905_14780 [Flavobacteriales bacterium]|nr:hypothetical protein [Flavobacteriales bacterium]